MTTPSAIVSTPDISTSVMNSVSNQRPDSENIFHIKKRSAYGNPSSANPIKRISTDLKRRNNLTSLFETKFFQHHFQPNNTILLHGDPIEEYYMIVSGIVRCCTINPEGARQIFRFAKKGDFLGLSDIDAWHFTAEAVDHVILKSIPHAQMKQALSKDIKLRDAVREQVCSQLEDRERQLLSMVSAKASERLFQFLCEFASSRPGTGYITLPMCRRDIADHLGLSVETVSRTFSELKRKGRIDLACSEKYKICTVPWH
ncbi:cAMP-binding protein [Hoeflea sp. IMCC20628]|uniref:Crp/Fnr family transcriptional regulator n=1 Tax=Hoeflea sp. IMCC20628 TaxID=1620421 RepID=UPI00063BD5AE|nr:Crp/Fnr family transcriptional regulator [Hoeflea sp. IMCC20628]AKH98782.1 cAMP-binding protein [Hoeflea sp. IMCC20628]